MSTPDMPLTLTPAPGTSGPVLYLNPYQGTYTTSRSYGLRMQRGFARGLSQTQARRQATLTAEQPLSEYQQRLLRFQERYGFSETLYRRWYRKYLREINEMASPGGQITKIMIQQVLVNGERDAAWIEQRLREKLEDMHDYRDNNSRRGPERTGYVHFWADASMRGFVPIEFWYYH